MEEKNEEQELPKTEPQEVTPPILEELNTESAFESPQIPTYERPRLDLSPVQQGAERVRNELRKVIVGQEDLFDFLLAALFTSGHVLIEGVPGIAKTLTAKMLSQSLDIGFSRIQFTPDLMPSDVIGTTVFNVQNSEFTFNEGPIFSNVVLIDEINRAPAKTQSALFEVMEEYQITVDGKTYKMGQPFFVLATQNPIEQEGTYKLPEAQLDRFLFKLNIEYPKLEEELSILKRFRNDFQQLVTTKVQAAFSEGEILRCRKLVENVHMDDSLLEYIARIVHQTRNDGDLFLGASPRASLAILKSSKAIAALDGRDFVTPDDIQKVAYPVLNHRIMLTPEREMEGYETRDVINNIIKSIDVPR